MPGARESAPGLDPIGPRRRPPFSATSFQRCDIVGPEIGEPPLTRRLRTSRLGSSLGLRRSSRSSQTRLNRPDKLTGGPPSEGGRNRIRNRSARHMPAATASLRLGYAVWR
jgi:hypothetical protein